YHSGSAALLSSFFSCFLSLYRAPCIVSVCSGLTGIYGELWDTPLPLIIVLLWDFYLSPFTLVYFLLADRYSFLLSLFVSCIFFTLLPLVKKIFLFFVRVVHQVIKRVLSVWHLLLGYHCFFCLYAHYSVTEHF